MTKKIKPTTLRISIFNVDLKTWKILRGMANDDNQIITTPEALLKKIEFTGGMFITPSWINKEELDFIDKFYELGRKLKN